MTPQELQQLLASGQSPSPTAPMADQYAWREALTAQRTGRTDLGGAPLSGQNPAAAQTNAPISAPMPQAQLGGPPASAPQQQMSADAFYAAANAAGQNMAAPQAQMPPPSPSAPQQPATGVSGAPTAAPPIPAPPIPHGGDAGLPPNSLNSSATPAGIGAQAPQFTAPPQAAISPAAIAQLTAQAPMISPQPTVAAHANPNTAITPASQTFHAASQRPAMPTFAGGQNLVPLRSYSPAPSMPGYAQARPGTSFINQPQAPAAPSAPGMSPMVPDPALFTAGFAGDSFTPYGGFSNGGMGGSLFSPSQMIPADPTIYDHYMSGKQVF